MLAQATGKWLRWATPARGILAVVVLVEVILFAGFHVDRWYKSLVPLGRPQALAGEGLVIRCDGHGYYAWLRSLLIDGDWSFDNEFDEHNVVGDFVPPPDSRTDLGRRTNQWSVGPACIWSLSVLPGHFIVQGLQLYGLPWAADGYSLPYQLIVGITTLLFSILGLGFVYGSCRHYAEPARAALAAAFLILGTTVVFYGAIEVTMAHSVGPTVVAGLIWYWLKTYGSLHPGRWFIVGTLVGLSALMRWQLVTFALLPTAECLFTLGRRHPAAANQIRRALGGLVLAGLGAVVAFTPQLIAWRTVYGHWLVIPVTVNSNWLHPSWWQVLATEDRGLFSWTPMALLACLAFLVCLMPQRQSAGADPTRNDALAILFAAFALQVYVLASLWGEMVQLGVSYGLRHFTESVIVLAPGLAILLERAKGWRFQLVCGLGCALVLWNLIVICQYRYAWIPAAEGVDLGTLLGNVPRLIYRKRLLLFGQVFVGPALLALIGLRLAKRKPQPISVVS